MAIWRALCAAALCVGVAAAWGATQQDLAAARDRSRQGLDAAKVSEWKTAAAHFIEAHKLAPGEPEHVFNLALAYSQLPGYDLRAIALFKSYLLARPDAGNAAAVRSQVEVLQAGYERKLVAIAAQLESILMQRQSMSLSHLNTETAAAVRSGYRQYGWDLAAMRYFLGQFGAAGQGLVKTNGADWKKDWLATFAGEETRLPAAMASAGQGEAALELLGAKADAESLGFVFESGRAELVEGLAAQGSVDALRLLGCSAYLGRDEARLAAIRPRLNENLLDRVADGSCGKALWWSAGRSEYLEKIALEGVMLNTDFNETQITDYFVQQDKSHQLGFDDLTAAASRMANLALEYRKVRGAAQQRDELPLTYILEANRHFGLGEYETALAQYRHAEAMGRRGPDITAAVARTQVAMTRPPVVERPGAVKVSSGGLGALVWAKLEPTRDYRDVVAQSRRLSALPDWKGSNLAALFEQKIRLFRSDAEASVVEGDTLKYSVGGVVLSAPIRGPGMQNPVYRNAIADAVVVAIIKGQVDDQFKAMRDRLTYLWPPGDAR